MECNIEDTIMKLRIIPVIVCFYCFALPNIGLTADFLKIAKEQVLPCFHPTSKIDEASAKFTIEPKTEDGITTAWVKIYYKGWIKKHSMKVKMRLLSSQTMDLLQVKMLEDTNTKTKACELMTTDKQWYELAH